MRQFARQDFFGAERAQMMLAETDASAVDRVEELLQLDRRKNAAAVKRIDDNLAERAAELHQKAAWQRNARSFDAHSARNLDVQNGERGRQAGVLVESLVEKRAARIVVVFVFAVKAFLFKQEAIDRFHDALDVARTLEPFTNGHAPLVDLLQVAVDLQARIILQCDHQRRFDKIERRLGKAGN